MMSNIEQKLEFLAKESIQLRLELMIRDVQLFDYWQLTILKNQIENQQDVLKQNIDDDKQEIEMKDQLNKIEQDQRQIEQTKDRVKRPRLRIERLGEIMKRTTTSNGKK